MPESTVSREPPHLDTRSRLTRPSEGVWAIFTLLYIAQLSDVLHPPFYGLIRSIDAIEYTANIVILSKQADLYSFVTVLYLMSILHLPRLRRGVSDLAGILPLLGVVAVFGLFLFDGSLASLVLIGVSALPIIAIDGSRLSGRKPLADYTMITLALLANIALLGGLRWASNGSIPGQSLIGSFWQPAWVGLQFLGLLCVILPELVLLFFFAWGGQLVINAHPSGQKGWSTDLDWGGTAFHLQPQYCLTLVRRWRSLELAL
jgi:hypothetical protein